MKVSSPSEWFNKDCGSKNHSTSLEVVRGVKSVSDFQKQNLRLNKFLNIFSSDGNECVVLGWRRRNAHLLVDVWAQGNCHQTDSGCMISGTVAAVIEESWQWSRQSRISERTEPSDSGSTDYRNTIFCFHVVRGARFGFSIHDFSYNTHGQS